MENVEWFLNDFKKVIKYEPMAVGMDNSDAFTGSVRHVWPKALIPLDDWHLNKSQLTNVKAFIKGDDTVKRRKSMNKNLHELRKFYYKGLF